MARSRQTPAPIIDVAFRAPASGRLPIETMSLARLKTLAPPEHFLRHERLKFHLFVLYLDGQSQHEVDFESLRVAAGSMVRVRPNQVHRWHLRAGLQGRLLLVGDQFLPTLPLPPGLAAATRLSVAMQARWVALLDLVLEETRPSNGGLYRVPILQHALMSSLYAVRRECEEQPRTPASSDDRLSRLAVKFQDAVESRFHRRMPVASLARLLGCNERTLARACLASCGRTPKAILDGRILLEARRLLAHTSLSAAEVGFRLGFTESTNFQKFFQRVSGESPTAFRARIALTS